MARSTAASKNDHITTRVFVLSLTTNKQHKNNLQLRWSHRCKLMCKVLSMLAKKLVLVKCPRKWIITSATATFRCLQICWRWLPPEPSVLWRWLVGWQEGHQACKKTEWWGAGVVICLERGANLHMAQLMPLPLSVSCFSKIQIGFTFLVPAHLGSTEKGR